MPKYEYKAKTKSGEDREGEMVAADTSEVARVLRRKGLVLVSAERKKEKRGLSLQIPFLSGVPLTAKMMFARNLRVMISAGLSLPRALRVLAKQTSNSNLEGILRETVKDLEKGESFSHSLEKHEGVFSDLFLNMIGVGEKGGSLEESLRALGRQMERQHELRSEIKGALIYPSVIILAMCAIGAAMLVYVVPKISETFEELGTELPPTTRFVIGLGNSLQRYWYLFLGGAAVLGLGFYYLRKTRLAKKMLSLVSIKTPFVSRLVRRVNAAYTLRSLSSLISAGVPLPDSLDVMAGTSSNLYYERVLREAKEEVKKGRRLSQTLEGKNIYPPLVVQMLAVGEETGETSNILDKLADFYEAQVARSMKNLASVIEPVIMLLIGGVVGFFAISMIRPMYSMLSAIK